MDNTKTRFNFTGLGKNEKYFRKWGNLLLFFGIN